MSDGISCNCSVRLDMDEIAKRLNSEQVEALFDGIAKVLSANLEATEEEKELEDERVTPSVG